MRPALPRRTRPNSSGPLTGPPSCRPWPGSWSRDGGGLCFVPRFPFVAGTSYTVVVGRPVAGRRSLRPARADPAAPPPRCCGIYPTAAEVPRNLLRFYMLVLRADERGRRGRARPPRRRRRRHRSRRRCCPPSTSCGTGTAAGSPSCSIRPGSSEACAPRQAGYPLQPGRAVPAGRRRRTPRTPPDARSGPVPSGATRSAPTSGSHVDPGALDLTVTRSRHLEPLVVDFDRPLDHGLLRRCLRVTDPGGRSVDGAPERARGAVVAPSCPRVPWAAGTPPARRRSGPRGSGRQLREPGVRPGPGSAEDAPQPVVPVAVPSARADLGRTCPPVPGAPTRANRLSARPADDGAVVRAVRRSG